MKASRSQSMLSQKWIRALVLAGVIAAALLATHSSAVPRSLAAAPTALPALVQEKCQRCHEVDSRPNRITQLRKSPEGWEATIRRMQRLWDVQLNATEARQLVKDLSDTRGLAPEEARRVQYWAVGDPTTHESLPEPLTATCVQCHTAGRILAQYRTPPEWQRLRDLHLGMNPSLPLQGEWRFVNWADQAGAALAWLAEQNPLETEAWHTWQQAQWPAVEGDWLVAGTQRGKGAFSGALHFQQSGDDEYQHTGQLTFTGGESVQLDGTLRVYTGFWGRASIEAGNDKLRGYYLLNADGTAGTGDWIGAQNTALGAKLTLRRPDAAGVLQVAPHAVQAGTEATLRITAAGLPDAPAAEALQLGDGVRVSAVQPVTAGVFDVDVTVAADAATGVREITIADAGASQLTVYQQVDYIRVSPRDVYSRVGAAGDSRPTPVQFEAIGYSAGPDGEPETGDDVGLGPVTAEWSLSEHQTFEGDTVDDVSFVGTLDAASGLFTPAAPGPNPERPQSNSNTGTVYVNAVHQRSDGTELTDKTVLLVTVPHWRDVH